MIGQLRKLSLLCLYALPVWIALRSAWLLLRSAWLLLRRRNRFQPFREVFLCLFVIFMAGILQMALDGKWAAPSEMLSAAATRLRTGEKIHLTLFQTIGPQLRALPRESALTQLLGNTLLFVPWGFCLPLLWLSFRKPLLLVCAALFLTCFIEFTQLFIDRFFELDDIFLNTLGSLLGSGLWGLLHRIWPQSDRYLLAGVRNP